jgi:hemoglobin/transferrin/lactoferrin receptor protein
MQAQSVAQTLLYEPNITTGGGPRAANQEVNIRGLTGNKVLQTVDGARQSFESGHRPSYFLDPELLASVEAVRGPVSSLWGSGALGGVVAQRTINAGDFLPGERDLGGFVKTGFNSNNNQHTSTAAVLGRNGGTDWLLSATTATAMTSSSATAKASRARPTRTAASSPRSRSPRRGSPPGVHLPRRAL